MADLPSGTVTFLFTDLEGSTRLWEEHPEAMKAALARHDGILQAAVAQHDGHVVKTTGDGLHAAFSTVHEALAAAIEAQRGLTTEEWSGVERLGVRMGLHTGEADVRDDDYYGTSVNRAARLAGVAHGGQVVVSHATEELVRDLLPAGVALMDLGEHHLRDLARPERVFQVCVPGLLVEFPPLRSLDAFPGNLPSRATSFVGREKDLGKVASALHDAPLVTLTGVGGVGKTRLALQVAAEVLPQYPDGAWLCELAAANAPDALVQMVAAGLGVPNRSGMDLAGSVVEYLRSKALLLVLDNCEHLLDAAGDLAQHIVETCPDVRPLATSREGLAVDGEQVIPLRSLGLPGATSDAAAVEASDAVRLFIERAGAVQADFSVSVSDLPAVAEICRRLDGIPLAIELAAARAVAMSPGEIAELLDERFRLLTGGRRSAVERHQTLRATVDWSYALLDERERLVFDRLGVFAGSFDGAAATGVAAGEGIERFDVLDALTSLVTKSMVIAERGGEATTRYQLLETLRLYARERLDETGVTDDWRRRHAEYYAAFAEQAGVELKGPDEIAWRTRIIEELDNLRAAVTWGLDRDGEADVRLAIRIVGSVSGEAAVHRASGIGAWAIRSLERAELMTDSQRFDVRCGACWDLFQRGDVVAARDLALLAIRDGVPQGVLTSSGSAHVCAASSSTILGDLDTALQIYADGYDVVADRPDGGYSRAALLAARAMSLSAYGRFDEAQAAAEEAHSLARQIRNPTGLGLALQALGWALRSSDPETALAAFEESLTLAESGAIQAGYDATLARVAPLRLQAGNPLGALDALLAAITHCREIGERFSVLTALDSLVIVLSELGETQAPVVATGVIQAEVFGPLGGLSGPELERHERYVAMARDALGNQAFEAALARGAAMNDDEALAYALRELERVRRALIDR